jgi:glycosyltransferase involved in cell wall biosynthesis
VSDEELNKLYKRTKLVVIPLRYGAGVKGKTVEAMHQGVPFVTTQFGIEGLEGINAIVTSHNTASAFADGVTILYNDNNGLIDFSKKAIDYISTHFSETNLRTIISKLF